MIKAMEIKTDPNRAKAKKRTNDLYFLGTLAACIGSIEIMREVFLPRAEQSIWLFAGAVLMTVWGVGKLIRYR